MQLTSLEDYFFPLTFIRKIFDFSYGMHSAVFQNPLEIRSRKKWGAHYFDLSFVALSAFKQKKNGRIFIQIEISTRREKKSTNKHIQDIPNDVSFFPEKTTLGEIASNQLSIVVGSLRLLHRAQEYQFNRGKFLRALFLFLSKNRRESFSKLFDSLLNGSFHYKLKSFTFFSSLTIRTHRLLRLIVTLKM